MAETIITHQSTKSAGVEAEARHIAGTLALAGPIEYDVGMTNPGPLRFESLDLLHTHEANLHRRCRSKIYQANRLAQEIGL